MIGSKYSDTAKLRAKAQTRIKRKIRSEKEKERIKRLKPKSGRSIKRTKNYTKQVISSF